MDDYKKDTVFFNTVKENKADVGEVLTEVYTALSEKGYKPINQIVG